MTRILLYLLCLTPFLTTPFFWSSSHLHLGLLVLIPCFIFLAEWFRGFFWDKKCPIQITWFAIVPGIGVLAGLFHLFLYLIRSPVSISGTDLVYSLPPNPGTLLLETIGWLGVTIFILCLGLSPPPSRDTSDSGTGNTKDTDSGETGVFILIGVCGLLLSLHALDQKFGIGFLPFSNGIAKDKITGPLQNSTYLGAYLAGALPITVFSAFLPKNNVLTSGLLIIPAILLGGLLVTGSRGGWVAALTSFVLLAGIVYISYRLQHQKEEQESDRNRSAGKKPEKKHARLTLAIAGSTILLFFLFGILSGPEFWTKVKSIADPSHPSNRVRILVWESTSKMLSDRPVVGTGPGNYHALFPPYRSKEETKLSDPSGSGSFTTRVGQAHNMFLQKFSEWGIPVAILFFTGLGLFFYLGIREFVVDPPGDSIRYFRSAGWLGSILALFIAGLVTGIWQSPSVLLLFWIASGFFLKEMGILRRYTSEIDSMKEKWLLLFLGISVTGLLLFSIYRYLSGSYYARKAVEYRGISDSVAKRSQLLKTSLKKFPYRDRLYLELGRLVDRQEKGGREAENYLMRAFSLAPFSYAACVTLAKFRYKHADRYKQSDKIKETAKILLKRALKISPTRPVAAHNLGLIELAEGNLDKSRVLLTKALKGNPNHLSSAASLARIAAREGDPKNLKHWLTYLKKNGYGKFGVLQRRKELQPYLEDPEIKRIFRDETTN